MVINYGQALQNALDQAMEQDPRVIVMGIGVDDHMAIFGSTKGLVQKYGPHRVFDTPLSEAAITGVAIGASLGGLKPVHIHIRVDFLYLALDQLLNLAAKWHYMFGEQGHLPFVVRAVIGRSWGQGAQHSQSLQSFFMHVPSIKLVMPTTPYDAKGLLLAAIADPNPVLMIEHRLLYYIEDEVPDEPFEMELGPAIIRQPGKDVTIVANSYMVVEALKAAEFLEEQGIDVEIVDPVCLAPLDSETILESVRKTGRLLVLDTSWVCCGASSEIAALVGENAHDALQAPIRRLGNQPVPCPVSKPLEDEFYPDARKIVKTIYELLEKEWHDPEIPSLSTPFKGPF